MAQSKIYYANTVPVWVEESQWVEFRLIDTILKPRIIEWVVPDPNNTVQKVGTERYFVGQKIFVQEFTTGAQITFFYGQVEFVENSYDSHFGQSIRIIARDMLSALQNYSLNLEYFTDPPNSRISATIAEAIANEVPAITPAFDTSSANWFMASLGAYAVVDNISYVRSKIEALQAFQRLARIDRVYNVRATKDFLIDAVAEDYEYGYYFFAGNYIGGVLRFFYFPRDNYVGVDVDDGNSVSSHKSILTIFSVANGSRVFNYDWGTTTYVDDTVAASNVTANDMFLIPDNPPQNNDAYYFGHSAKFNRMVLNIGTAGVKGGGAWTINYEYWNGTSWTTLDSPAGSLVDNTEEFTVGQSSLIYWNMPSNWVENSVNTITKYWIRFRLSGTNGNPAGTLPLGTQAWIKDAGISGLAVQFKGTSSNQVKPMMADYTFSKYPSEIITETTVHYEVLASKVAAEVVLPAAPSIEGAYPNGIGRRKEEHSHMYEFRNSTIANVGAKAIIWQQMQLNGILRGDFSIPYYPYFVSGGTTYLVRSGHTIKVINSNANVNQDMIITSIEYSEPSFISKIKTMEVLKGYGSLRY